MTMNCLLKATKATLRNIAFTRKLAGTFGKKASSTDFGGQVANNYRFLRMEPEEILGTLGNEFSTRGFEFHPFKVGWYNSCVQPVFHLKYEEDALAVLIISNPSMFESTFLPYLREMYSENKIWDPVDECMVSCFSKINDIFPNVATEVIHDFDLHPNRRPKLLMQPAAHVAGAAYFYQRKDLPIDAFPDKKVYGVCIHPKYGGWFAVRGVVIFPDVLCPDLKMKHPKDVVPSAEQRIKLLKMFNDHWQDFKYRDIIPVAEKYSDIAIRYFSTLPKDRFQLVEDFLELKKGHMIVC